MNYSTPILIAENQIEIRNLLREMLTKHGFFHFLEAENTTDTLDLLYKEKNLFLIIKENMINNEMISLIANKKDFIIISSKEEFATLFASRFGVKHIMTFPYSSKGVVNKIKELQD